MTAHRSAAGAEPQQTAAAVRELIEAMRLRLESAIEDRTRLAGELEEARAALGRGEAELKKERRARGLLETQAEERRRIAEEAVAEAEALAAERDQVLEELAGLRGSKTRRGCCRKRRRSWPTWTGGCRRRSRPKRAPRRGAGSSRRKWSACPRPAKRSRLWSRL